jgi:hypothetical protein
MACDKCHAVYFRVPFEVMRMMRLLKMSTRAAATLVGTWKLTLQPHMSDQPWTRAHPLTGEGSVVTLADVRVSRRTWWVCWQEFWIACRLHRKRHLKLCSLSGGEHGAARVICESRIRHVNEYRLHSPHSIVSAPYHTVLHMGGRSSRNLYYSR